MPEEIQPQLKSPSKPTKTESTPSGPPALPGFWPRAAAFGVDLAFLTLVLYYIGKLGLEALYPLRGAAQLLGLLLAFAYFWLCSTPMTNGQTIGKKVFGLRVTGRDGKIPPVGAVTVRALLLQIVIFAYVGLVGRVLFRQNLLEYPPTALWFIGFLAAFYLAGGFAAANGVFLGLHPKKTSLHDALTGTAVIRASREAEGIAEHADWDDVARAKVRMARWPAICAAGLFVILFGQTAWKAWPELTKYEEIYLAARAGIDVPGFQLAMVLGPSRERHASVEKMLAERSEKHRQLLEKGDLEQAARYAPPTTETLRNIYTGRQFQFVFVCEEYVTSQTIASSPAYEDLLRQLGALSEDLSGRFFLESPSAGEEKTEDSETDAEEPAVEEAPTPSEYDLIQTAFVRVLPLYLYKRVEWVWLDAEDVADLPPAVGRSGRRWAGMAEDEVGPEGSNAAAGSGGRAGSRGRSGATGGAEEAEISVLDDLPDLELRGLAGIRASVLLSDEYLKDAEERLRAHFSYPFNAVARLDENVQAVVRFEILPDGTIRDIRTAHSSGDEVLDEYALGAVREAAVLGAVDKYTDRSRVAFLVPFVFSRDGSAGGSR